MGGGEGVERGGRGWRGVGGEGGGEEIRQWKCGGGGCVGQDIKDRAEGAKQKVPPFSQHLASLYTVYKNSVNYNLKTRSPSPPPLHVT